MSTSETFSFDPALGSMGLNAFARCGVRRTEITQQHMDDLYLEANFLQSDWSVDGFFFWTVEQVQQPLPAAAPPYGLPANTVPPLDFYFSPDSGQPAQNRLITPF